MKSELMLTEKTPQIPESGLHLNILLDWKL